MYLNFWIWVVLSWKVWKIAWLYDFYLSWLSNNYISQASKGLFVEPCTMKICLRENSGIQKYVTCWHDDPAGLERDYAVKWDCGICMNQPVAHPLASMPTTVVSLPFIFHYGSAPQPCHVITPPSLNLNSFIVNCHQALFIFQICSNNYLTRACNILLSERERN